MSGSDAMLAASHPLPKPALSTAAAATAACCVPIPKPLGGTLQRPSARSPCRSSRGHGKPAAERQPKGECRGSTGRADKPAATECCATVSGDITATSSKPVPGGAPQLFPEVSAVAPPKRKRRADSAASRQASAAESETGGREEGGSARADPTPAKYALDPVPPGCVQSPGAPRGPMRKVRFDMAAVKVHEVIPYSEVYGVHPRDFAFERDGFMYLLEPGTGHWLTAATVGSHAPLEWPEAEDSDATLEDGVGCVLSRPCTARAADCSGSEGWYGDELGGLDDSWVILGSS